MCDKASACGMSKAADCTSSIITVSVLIYKSLCNTVYICGHGNKATCGCCCFYRDVNVSQRMLAIFKNWIIG